MTVKSNSRRQFLKRTSLAVASTLALPLFGASTKKDRYAISAHLWVYASRYPPDWNCNPIMETVFKDLKHAGLNGVELMEVNLRDSAAVQKLKDLISRYEFPVTGTSYGADMWKRELRSEILDDVKLVVANLSSVGGKTFGISVKTPGRLKTEKELDDQAELLQAIRKVCNDHGVTPNLHNHTYEVENNLHDLGGTLKRLPDFPLGPDIGWLAKAGVDPVNFVKKYGKQMVYMHLRDIDSEGEWTEVPGQGTIDFRSVAAALRETGFSGSIAIELAFASGFKPTRELKESWKISQDYIDRIFNA
jgi:sugar phosphate isomerase/epimerase